MTSEETILSETFTLGPAEGLTRTLDVPVPANATRIRVDVELTGAAAGVSWSGPGGCSGGTQGSIGQHNQATTGGSCPAPAEGIHPMVFELTAGEVEITVRVTATKVA